MSTACPKCGSRYLRPSRARSSSEKLGLFSLRSPVRCLHCKARFIAPDVVWADFFYARCPVCRRMDLNGWTGKTYTNPPAWVAFKVLLGARKWRCEYCRLNFASFRRRKEVFTFKRWKRFVPQAEEPYTPGDTPDRQPEEVDRDDFHERSRSVGAGGTTGGSAEG